MTVYEVIILCAFNLLSFIIGAKIGQVSIKGRDIKINPIKAIKEDIRENKIAKEDNLRKRKIDTMLQNIDKYDGTSLGQKEIPRD